MLAFALCSVFVGCWWIFVTFLYDIRTRFYLFLGIFSLIYIFVFGRAILLNLFWIWFRWFFWILLVRLSSLSLHIYMLSVFIEFRCCTFHDLSQSQEMNNHKKQHTVHQPVEKNQNSKARCLFFRRFVIFNPVFFSLSICLLRFLFYLSCVFFCLSWFQFVPRW